MSLAERSMLRVRAIIFIHTLLKSALVVLAGGGLTSTTAVAATAIVPSTPAGNGLLWLGLLVLLGAGVVIYLCSSRFRPQDKAAGDFYALANNAHDGIFIVQRGLLVFANQRAGEILGYKPSELCTRDLQSIVHPDEAGHVLDIHQRRMKGETVPSQYEVTFLNRQGNKVPVELTAAVTRWRGHEAGLVIIRDITERKLIEQTLQDSEKRYRSLVENSPDAILIIDAETNAIIEANEQAEHLFRLSKQDLFAIDLDTLTQPPVGTHRQSPCTDYLEKALHGQPLIFERDFQTPDGDTLCCEVRLSRMPFPHRKLIRGSIIDITQRKLFQTALAKSEERLASFFQASCETLIFHDNGRILDANDVVQTMFGYPKQDMVGRHVLEFIAPESEALVRQNMQQGLEGPYELMAVRKNGQHFPVQIRAKTLHLDDRSQRIVSVTDISDLRQAHARHQMTEENLHHILDNMIDTFYRADKQGRLVMVSPSAEDLLGYRPDELIGIELASLYAKPHSRRFFLSALQANGGRITAHETALRHKNGHTVWVSANARFIYDAEGNIDGVEGITRNITQQRNIKHALRRARDELEIRVRQRTEQLSKKVQELQILQSKLQASEQNFRAVFEGAVDSFLIYNAAGQILDANRHACESLGYDRRELVDLHIQDIADGPAATAPRDILSSLQTRKSLQLEGAYRRKDGSTFPVEIKLGLLDTAAHQDILALVRDITSRKEAETLLISARDQAERSSQAKSEFLSRMSHELRTPLNAIIGFSEFLSSDVTEPLTPSQQESIEEIFKAGQHLLNLMDDLLEISTIESGKITIRPEKTNINALAQECIALIQPLAHRKAITVQDELQNSPPVYIHVDPTRLKQVMINLLSNAIKYNKQGGDVSVSMEINDNKARIAVTDTGPGLTEDQQNRLFLPFERLYAQAGIDGSGIGLNICKHLTEMMGGRIDVKSQYRNGSQFRLEFSLPAHAPSGQ